MKDYLSWASAIISISLYFPLVIGILKGVIKQNFTTWLLWVILDTIALIGIIREHGNYILLASYVTGGSIVTISLLKMRLFKWTRFETIITISVIISMVIWYYSGNIGAIISSTLAVFLAGLLQVIDSWDEPDVKNGFIYLGYTLANLLSFFAGKSWAIEEWFYPGVCAILCIIVAGASFRKKPVRNSPAFRPLVELS